MPHEVAAFLRREQLKRPGDEVDDLVEGARSSGAQEGSQLRKRELDRIEIRTVGGRKRSRAPTRSMATCTAGCLCMAKLSSTTTSPGWSVGTRTLFDVGEQRRIVECAVEHRRRVQTVDAQGRDDVCCAYWKLVL